MSKPKSASNPLTKVLIVVLIGVLSLLFTYPIFVTVPVLIYYVWDNYDKRKELEKRVAELESGQKTGPASA